MKKKQQIKINELPIILEADDYYEFSNWEWLFKQIGLPLKIEELDSNWFGRPYNAIIYIKKDKKYKKMIADLKRNFEEIEKEECKCQKDNFHYIYPDDAR